MIVTGKSFPSLKGVKSPTIGWLVKHGIEAFGLDPVTQKLLAAAERLEAKEAGLDQ